MTSPTIFFRIIVLIAAALTIILILIERQGQVISDWASNTVLLRGGSSGGECGYQNIFSSSSRGGKSNYIYNNNTDDRGQRPPLSSLIDLTITSKTEERKFVKNLLDFAIIGHPKTATSFTMDWLANHDEIHMYTHELHALQSNNPAEFVQLMYDLPEGDQYTKRGYKAPRDIANINALDLLAEYWPNAKLIVGLRHPVLWFESFYNFRARQGYNMTPAHHPMYFGTCSRATHGVCTHEALFHHHLALLGKTDMATYDEVDLFLPGPPKRRPEHETISNKIFLYEITQLYNENQTRAVSYRQDLSNYLGLKQILSPIVRIPNPDSTKKMNPPLDICLDMYKPLRDELILNGRAASTWIRTYFLDHPDVTVSSPEYFRELLLTWMDDPCDKRQLEEDSGRI